MTEETSFTRKDLKGVIDIFQSHPDWEFKNESTDVNSVIEAGVQAESPEFVYDHRDTRGSLHLQIPKNPEESIVSGNLAQFLDPDLPHDPNPGYLSGELVTTTQSIVSQQNSDFITPTENAYDTLFFDVPVDYQEEEFIEALDQASRTSKQVQEMYDEIDAVIEKYRL